MAASADGSMLIERGLAMMGQGPAAQQAVFNASLRRVHPDVSFEAFEKWWMSPACKLRRILQTVNTYGHKCMAPDALNPEISARAHLRRAKDVIDTARGVGGHRNQLVDFQDPGKPVRGTVGSCHW